MVGYKQLVTIAILSVYAHTRPLSLSAGTMIYFPL